MLSENYFITIQSESEQAADVGARSLADSLREINGIVSADRIKRNDSTMDLGAIVGVIAASGATLALAQGLADWLRLRRSTTVVVERYGPNNSIKATISQIDPEAAKQIFEVILHA